jgi:hypothetical protein
MSEPRPKWRPTHCRRGEAPLPVMLITDADGTAVFHDGFAPAAKLLSDIFHRLYMPIEEYGKRPRRKKADLLVALETGGPLPKAKQLAKRGKRGRQPPTTLGFFA